MGTMERIDLAHEEPFRLGRLTVRPGLRQLVRDDGIEEVVEPRVMQVLVALARRPGGIVSRDDLTSSCWEGRVVGEDAINRVISRLRRSAEGTGEGAFRIETITKVGYRLVGEAAAEAATPAPGEAAAAMAEVRKLKLDRRAVLIGSGLALAGAGGWWGIRRLRKTDDHTPPPEVRDLVDQARNAAMQGTFEGSTQAQGLLRRVTELRPDYADGWGFLAINYAAASVGLETTEARTMVARTREAARRAMAIEPGNPPALVALDLLKPPFGRWAEQEKLARAILATHPREPSACGMLRSTLLSVGRFREAADLPVDNWTETLGPGPSYSRVVMLWGANRLDAADKAMDEAFRLFPTHFAVWFTRYYLLLYTNRAGQALAMGEDRNGWPTGIPEWNFEMINTVARAIISGRKADVDAAMTANMAAAHKGAGYAENTVQFASTLGRIDDAFAVLDAYYFGRGFETGDIRFAPEQRVYTRQNYRRTRMLFLPSMTAVRADPRFGKLMTELGLAQYWKQAGVLPDYQRYR
jgi:DNA-binding winged helix-turn-helix (wHTH) protein